MNGGESQPGCPMQFDACSHVRVTMLYAESIESTEKFVSSANCASIFFWLLGLCKCRENCPRMGHHADLNLEGSFYLKTKSDYPFSENASKNKLFPFMYIYYLCYMFYLHFVCIQY